MATKLAKLLAKNLKKQKLLGFGELVLLKSTPGTRAPDAASGGTNPTSDDPIECSGRQGQHRSAYWQYWQNAQASTGTTRTRFVGFSILGATLPDGVRPVAGDRIVHNGVTYTIAADGVTNPDGIGAMYECMTRAPGG